MFSLICTIAALTLAAFAHPKYRFVAYLVAFEFAAHYIVYNYLFLDLRSENSGLIYVLYAFIQVMVLLFMYMRQTHFIIAALVFLNLVYNFLTTLQHLHLTGVNFHDPYVFVARGIMILELFYLLGANIYVSTYLKRNGYLDLDAIDSAILVWRRPTDRDLVQGNEI
ncbi:MAG: hypothetical protein GY820_38240 [Gammaproteobacteria bacterium]|nr:hypothetical protein [Gammaproteobacteria bacterium]